MRRENNKADEVLHEVVRHGEIVVLLAGGDKSTQKQDIEKAKALAATI